MGDFNPLISGDERIGGNAPNPISMSDFSQCIQNSSLIDDGFVGSKYTWTNGKLSQRLDRVLCDQLCLDTFLVLNVCHLAKTASIKWMQDGDKSTSFFHAWVKQRRRKKGYCRYFD
ncbi:hypothetical protein LIER_11674 [Lithospermum erythrorhizon]|uniref:Uncharacterized protein n=1 Tax=Lithospermum erythrorhizon TaxID=34254 RepID=A0AAV3PU05_LITER